MAVVKMVVVRTRRRMAREFFAHIADFVLAHPAVDVFVAVLLHAGYLLALCRGLPNYLAAIPSEQRLTIYAALATVGTLAAGAATAAIGFYHSANGPAADQLRTNQGSAIRKNFRSVTRWLWLIAVAVVIAMCIDGHDLPNGDVGPTHGSEWIATSALVMLALKFARLSFLQDLFLKVNDYQAAKKAAR